MPTEKRIAIEEEKNAKQRAFEYQLEILKFEMGYIEHSIARMDEITQTTKYWAILIWSGSISLILGQQTLKQYVLFTAAIPLSFALIDARWRFWLGRFSDRQGKISAFINSSDLEKAMKTYDLSGFIVLDPMGKLNRNDPDLKKKRTFRRALRSTEVLPFYLGMLLISLTIGTFFYLNPIP